jgi:peroxiredoxin family protein
MNNKLALILFSGTADKLMAAANIAAGAAAAGLEVHIFLTFGGLLAFRKDDWKSNDRVSADLGPQAAQVQAALQQSGVPSWLQVLKDASEIGSVKISACLMSLEMFNLKLEDLEPIVTDVATVSNFLGAMAGGTPLFI